MILLIRYNQKSIKKSNILITKYSKKIMLRKYINLDVTVTGKLNF